MMLLDTISQDVRTELPWELLYADDLAIIDITNEDTQNRLESWQKVLRKQRLCWKYVICKCKRIAKQTILYNKFRGETIFKTTPSERPLHVP